RIEDYKKGPYFTEIKKRAEDEGVSIDPIPWDKVNKVYTLKKVKTLDESLIDSH
ncbi:nitroreductase, partial [Vibrio furnissii]|nr:nitroreductase [Vibrio furnissii]